MLYALCILLKINVISCCVLNAVWKTVESWGGMFMYVTISVFQLIVIVNCNIKITNGMVDMISALLPGIR